MRDENAPARAASDARDRFCLDARCAGGGRGRYAPGRLHDRRIDKRGGPERTPRSLIPRRDIIDVSARDGSSYGEVFKADGVASPATAERRRQPSRG